jgi:hypothetical protein
LMPGTYLYFSNEIIRYVQCRTLNGFLQGRMNYMRNGSLVQLRGVCAVWLKYVWVKWLSVIRIIDIEPKRTIRA